MDRYFVQKDNWDSFIQTLLNEFEVYAPVEAENDIYFTKITKENIPNIVWGKYRCAQSAKAFATPFLEEVVSKRESVIKKIIVFGMRNCDLIALDMQDAVFEQQLPQDPFYTTRRHGIIYAGSDCTNIKESCFCTLWGIAAFPEKNFDMSVGVLKDGFVLEVANQIGRSLIIKSGLKTNTLIESHLAQRQEYRNTVQEKLNTANMDFHFFAGRNITAEGRARLVEKKEESPAWLPHANNCVSCGACTQVCPTCHCFLLAELKGADFEKNKYWDSCQFSGYGRVAGGANPRKKISERLSNRYYCKLINRPLRFNGVLGCTGCGRCIEACQGGIDIRKVIKDVTRSA